MGVKCKIIKFWELEIKNQAKLKSTLKYLNLESFTAGKVHNLWSSAKYNSHGVQKAFLRCRELQLTRKRFIRQLVLTLETAEDTSPRRWAGEDVLRVILDASVLYAWFVEVDDDFLDTIFSLTRSLCNALHAKCSALLDCA